MTATRSSEAKHIDAVQELEIHAHVHEVKSKLEEEVTLVDDEALHYVVTTVLCRCCAQS